MARRPIRARLIFNPGSGNPEEAEQHLADILAEMRSQGILPEVYVVGPNSRIGAVVQNSIRSGIKLVVVAGGDGTIDRVAGAMIGGPATFGVIPIGTRNNVALSLGIPKDIPEAIRWFRMAADQGITDAQYVLGQQYALGEYIPKDLVEAYVWLDLAAESYSAAENAEAESAVQARDLSLGS